MASVVTTVPVHRLIKNLSRYIKEHPQDARGYYSLGRIHSFALVQGTDSVHVEPGLMEYPPKFDKGRIGFYKSERKQESDLDRARQHLGQAVLNYNKATELDSSQAMYFLGLGWILQRGAEEALNFGAPPAMPRCHPTTYESYDHLIGRLVFEGSRAEAFDLLVDNLPCAIGALVHSYRHGLQSRFQEKLVRRLIARAWEDGAIGAYRKAIELSFDREYKGGGDSSGDAVCIEAADHILEILRWNRSAEERTSEDLKEIASLEAMKEKYRNSPVSRAISPIVFPLEEHLTFSDMINTTARVPFDLDGSGGDLLWPWLKPNAAFLVWDPSNEGQITSGLQLFGSVTWWMFWQDGYQALAALDDDGNGWLEGVELDGIGVWHDKDSDAISDRGEVIPASRSIRRIRVVPNMLEDDQPASSTGLVMRDGRVLPTLDWMPVGIPADLSGTAVGTETGCSRER